jgi:hypothetical protein
MNCKKFKERIFMFQDRQLTGPQLAEWEKHRRHCPSCAETFAAVEAAASRFEAAADPVPVPDWNGSWQKIATAIEPRPRTKFSFRFSPRLALLSSGFLIFFVMGVVVARFFIFTPTPLRSRSSEVVDDFTFTAQDYFTALQPVMNEYGNTRNVGAVNPVDQDLVRRFLSNLYLLKLRAEKTKDVSLQHLLADIELVLLEIVHLDRSNPENSRLVGALIQEKGISLKMKVFKFSDRKNVRI